MIKRRLIFQVAGYDPVDAARQRRRFVRGLAAFVKTWNVDVAATELVTPSPDQSPRWTVTTRGANWRVESVFEPFSWNDIVAVDLSRSMPQRLMLFAKAMADFFRTGTAVRYFRAQWRYGLFFLYPAFCLLAFAGAGIALGTALGAAWRLEGAAHAGAAIAIAAVAFGVLLRWPGRRWHVLQALDDWIFAWDFVHGRRFDMETRIGRFARRLADAAQEARYDEIVVVGHSLGATLAVQAVARALDSDARLGSRGIPVVLVTVGSTIPKFTLHPAADRLRADVARVAESGVQWAEFHARADPISFYRFDPVTGTRMDDRYDRQPVIRMVRLRASLSRRSYWRIQHRFMRVHHQCVMANERRTNYDFYMMCCGPVPVLQSAVRLDGPAEFFAADGALLDAPVARPSKIASEVAPKIAATSR